MIKSMFAALCLTAAMAVPVLGVGSASAAAATTTTTQPSTMTSTTSTMPTKPPVKKASIKHEVCKPTKTHHCPVVRKHPVMKHASAKPVKPASNQG